MGLITLYINVHEKTTSICGVYFIGVGYEKFFIRVLCCLIPSSRLRHKFRYWLRAGNYVNNKIIIVAQDGTRR